MKLLYRLFFVTGFLVVLVLVIAIARGYRIDFENRSLSSTGILAISSHPRAAKVYINDTLKGVTDINLTLSPGAYRIEVKKDGYTSWSKEVTLRGELVMSIDAILFPLNPTLSPLTNLGILKAIPVYPTEKIVLFSETGDETKDGIYLFDPVNQPISFLTPLKQLLLKKDAAALVGEVNLAQTSVTFSPDNTQGIFDFVLLDGTQRIFSYLVSLDEANGTPFDVSTSKETLLAAWKRQRELDTLKIFESFPREFTKIATDSFQMVQFSPEETKILYQVNKPVNLPYMIKPRLIAANQTPETRTLDKDSYYLYDKKEDRNYKLPSPPSNLLWYADSKHLLFIEGKKISIIDYDGLNKQTVYSGPFENSFFTTTSDGKIIILTNLNPEANKFPDLYSISVR
ncbi:PEGA domain-containing protein [Candidatus Roizmanbacteria bacterium]|nr:PEGA domain-containing protein [Candidatus Roizmanbacteria bacterium]